MDKRPSAAEHIAFVSEIDDWLARAGVDDPDRRATLAVGLADSLRAADHVREDLRDSLRLDPSDPAQADQALSHVANIHVQLFTELKHHLLEMEDIWEEALEVPLDARSSTDSS
jgi:hypothetical protein